MMNGYKRSMTQPVAVSNDNISEQLATIGMRIRKSVADGYNVPTNVNDGSDTYSYNNNGNIRRQPLPSHVSQPPSLSNQFSTFDSGSNLSEWERNHQLHTPAIQSLLTPSNNKRKFDSEQEDYVHPTYGSLKFNEEF